MTAGTKKNTVNVKYTGCGHTFACTSESIASTHLTCTGSCPRCKNVPLLIYLFEDIYYIHFPAEMQPEGMGSLGIPMPFDSTSDFNAVIEAVQRQYPMGRVLRARVISPTMYEILKRHGHIRTDQHGFELATLPVDSSTALTAFVVREDATDPECTRLEGTPFINDDHLTFEEVDEAIRRSEANRAALAGFHVVHYDTCEHTAFAVAKRKKLTVIVLPERLPPTRVNGEPYRFALCSKEE